MPATAATTAIAGPVTARWNLTDLTELGVLKLDKRNLLSGAWRRSASTQFSRTARNSGLQRADVSQVQGDGPAQRRPSRTQGAVERILCPMLRFMAFRIANKTV